MDYSEDVLCVKKTPLNQITEWVLGCQSDKTKVKHIGRRNHRAVSAVIGTLLMSVISVMGGTFVFASSQEYFTSAGLEKPTLELVFIIGYDATDSNKLRDHTGETFTIGNRSNEKLSEGDFIAIYINNLSPQAITVDEVNLNGQSHQFDDSGDITDIEPNTFGISHGGDATSQGTYVIEAGQDATIWIHYGEKSDPVKVGRPMLVLITTGSGNTFSEVIQNGNLG